MIKNDYISAAENFEYFLAKKSRHSKRTKAIKMLQYCQIQIPYHNYSNCEFCDIRGIPVTSLKEYPPLLSIRAKQGVLLTNGPSGAHQVKITTVG